MRVHEGTGVRAKHDWIVDDPMKGLKAAHPRLTEFLIWLVIFCKENKKRMGWQKWLIDTTPVVTDAGRTDNDMLNEYLEAARKDVRARIKGMTEQEVNLTAIKIVLDRKSWHKLRRNGKFSAVDIRRWTYGPLFRALLLAKARERFPGIEALDEGDHLHFGLPVKDEAKSA